MADPSQESIWRRLRAPLRERWGPAEEMSVLKRNYWQEGKANWVRADAEKSRLLGAVEVGMPTATVITAELIALACGFPAALNVGAAVGAAILGWAAVPGLWAIGVSAAAPWIQRKKARDEAFKAERGLITAREESEETARHIREVHEAAESNLRREIEVREQQLTEADGRFRLAEERMQFVWRLALEEISAQGVLMRWREGHDSQGVEPFDFESDAKWFAQWTEGLVTQMRSHGYYDEALQFQSTSPATRDELLQEMQRRGGMLSTFVESGIDRAFREG
jgi:hypothetical protein